MATSRRSFLKTGTMGLLCAGIPGVLADVVSGHPTLTYTQEGAINLTKATFSPYINSRFRVRNGINPVDLTLTTIKDFKADAPDPSKIAGRECFSLIFSAPSGSLLKEGIQDFEHEALGNFSLFLAPVGKSVNRRYEAIISRL